MILTVTMPKKMNDLLQEYKRKSGLKKSDIIRRAVEMYIRQFPVIESIEESNAINQIPSMVPPQEGVKVDDINN